MVIRDVTSRRQIAVFLAVLAFAGLDTRANVAKYDARLAADTTRGVENGLVWIDAATLPMESKLCDGTSAPYGRIPRRFIDSVPDGVRGMANHTTGHYFRFRTDSGSLGVRWECAQKHENDPYIPPQGMYGVDIYTRQNGIWKFVGNGRLDCVRDSKTGKVAVWDEMVVGLPGKEDREVLVYLPIRAEIRWVKLGLKPGAKLEPVRAAGGNGKPVVHYGTSLVHGGCASRPGLVFTSLAARELDVDYVNLGFSGSARLEPVMADVMATREASLYIVDTVWNCDEELIRTRTEPFLRRLHELRPETPILLCEGPEAAGWRLGTNEELKKVHARLKGCGALDGRLHYLAADGMLPLDGESTHDYIHPNDYGSIALGRVFAAKIREILK